MKKYYKKLLSILTFLVTLTYSGVVFAAVVEDYATEVRTTLANTSLSQQAREQISSFLTALTICLNADSDTQPNQKNWQYSSTATPTTTVQELRSSFASPRHPCALEKSELDRAITEANASAPASATQNANQAEQTTNTSTNAANNDSTPANNQSSASDGIPLYQRITPPSNRDVLTPNIATNDPTIGGFVNYLFDLFVRRLLPWLVAVMVLLLIWAGYNYILANGDSAKIKQAKDMILYSIIAIIIAFASLSIITVLNNLITALH